MNKITGIPTQSPISAIEAQSAKIQSTLSQNSLVSHRLVPQAQARRSYERQIRAHKGRGALRFIMSKSRQRTLIYYEYVNGG